DPASPSYEQQVAGWNDAVALVSDARGKESEAHSTLAQALSLAIDDGVISDVLKFLGLLPADREPVHVGNWLFGLGGLAFGASVSHFVTTRYGVFQPRTALGRWISPAGLGFWGRFRVGLNPSHNWHALPWHAAERARWT